MPALIYLITTILYVAARRRLPGEHGFRLGLLEIPVLAVALVWLAFEMSIFRDSSFATPWLYAAVMMGIGLVYFAFLVATRRSFAMPGGARAFDSAGRLAPPGPPGQPNPDQASGDTADGDAAP